MLVLARPDQLIENIDQFLHSAGGGRQISRSGCVFAGFSSFFLNYFDFSLDKIAKFVMLVVQSESVTLSVDYLISSAQAGTTCLGFFCGRLWVRNGLEQISSCVVFKATMGGTLKVA